MTIEKSLPNMILVCVDGVKEGDIYGRYFHRYKKEETSFFNSAVLLTKVEQFFDTIGYPQATTRARTFIESARENVPAKELPQAVCDSGDFMQFRGKLATFLVGVTSRQNASWQGEAVWMEQEIKKQFQSDMELVVFVDDAVKKSEI